MCYHYSNQGDWVRLWQTYGLVQHKFLTIVQASVNIMLISFAKWSVNWDNLLPPLANVDCNFNRIESPLCVASFGGEISCSRNTILLIHNSICEQPGLVTMLYVYLQCDIIPAHILPPRLESAIFAQLQACNFIIFAR